MYNYINGKIDNSDTDDLFSACLADRQDKKKPKQKALQFSDEAKAVFKAGTTAACLTARQVE